MIIPDLLPLVLSYTDARTASRTRLICKSYKNRIDKEAKAIYHPAAFKAKEAWKAYQEHEARLKKLNAAYQKCQSINQAFKKSWKTITVYFFNEKFLLLKAIFQILKKIFPELGQIANEQDLLKKQLKAYSLKAERIKAQIASLPDFRQKRKSYLDAKEAYRSYLANPNIEKAEVAIQNLIGCRRDWTPLPQIDIGNEFLSILHEHVKLPAPIVCCTNSHGQRLILIEKNKKRYALYPAGPASWCFKGAGPAQTPTLIIDHGEVITGAAQQFEQLLLFLNKKKSL